MAHKNDYTLYLISRQKVGNIYREKEALVEFGYSMHTRPYDTRLLKYLDKVASITGGNRLYKVKNFAAVTDEVIKNYRLGKFRNKKQVFRRVSGTEFYLVPRKIVPFWLLKEYGGEII